MQGLHDRFGAESRFSLREGDVLEAPLHLVDGGFANKVVANIPYNITGPLLGRLVGRLDHPVEPTYDCLVLLLQKEVAANNLERREGRGRPGRRIPIQGRRIGGGICPKPTQKKKPRSY